MTHTLVIDNLSSDVSDVSVPLLDQSGISVMSDTIQPDGTRTVTYVLPTGDPLYPTRIFVTIRRDKDYGPGKAGQIRTSITIASWATDTDEDGMVVAKQPCSAAISWQLPFVSVEAADVSQLLGNLFGLTFNTLTSKVRDTAVIGKLLFGLPGDLY